MTDKELMNAVRPLAGRSTLRFHMDSPALLEMLRAAVDAAQPANQDAVDAARYRWLRDSQRDWQICYWSDEFDAWQDVQSNERKNIDAAIDAAMKEKNND